MKPKTKLQKRVVELSTKLKPITHKQQAWAYENCLDLYAIRSRITLTCLECGHSWKDKHVLETSIIGCQCPRCEMDLKMWQNYRPNCRDSAYFGIITTKAEFQVVRMFWVQKTMKKGERSVYGITEVMQHWINEAGEITTMAKNIQGFSQYFDQWIFQSELEIRPKQFKDSPRFNIVPYKIYPSKRILPLFKRNGFRGDFHDLAPHQLLSLIVTDSYAETLLKAGQISLLKYYFGHGIQSIRSAWNSIRICMRNSYIVKDAGIWLDHIDLLRFFGKDLHSPKYVCPADLGGDHVRLSRKKHEIERKRRQIEHLAKVEAEQKDFEERIGKFLDLVFEDREIIVEPLKSVEEFVKEGEELRHCVFSNAYYKKPDSLILSAKIDKRPVETIEVSLSMLKIVQARGRGNAPSEYHDRIVKTVNQYMPIIAERV